MKFMNILQKAILSLFSVHLCFTTTNNLILFKKWTILLFEQDLVERRETI